MQTVIELIKTLSVISVVLAAVWMLIPKGSMEKSLKYALSMFVTAAIVAAVMTALQRGFVLDEIPTVAKTDVIKSAGDISEVTAEYIIAGLLDEAGIKYRKIDVTMDILDDSGISIIKATAQLQNRAEAERAAQIVWEQTGIRLTEE